MHTRKKKQVAKTTLENRIDVIYESIDQPKVALSINQIPLSWKLQNFVMFFLLLAAINSKNLK